MAETGNGMTDIGFARAALLAGKRVRRSGWNGKGMYLEYVPSTRCQILVWDPKQSAPLPWVGMSTAQGDFVPWLCSQTDLLATDWEVVQ